jgi:hypothetical protein
MRPWFPKKLARLDDLRSLAPGWIAGGQAPTVASVDVAGRLLAVIAMLIEVAPAYSVQIFPTPDGGLSLEWHEGGWDAEIGISSTGVIDVWAWHKTRAITFTFPEQP